MDKHRFTYEAQAEADKVLDELTPRDRGVFGAVLVGLLLIQMSQDDELPKNHQIALKDLARMHRKVIHELGATHEELFAQKDLVQFILVLRDGNPL